MLPAWSARTFCLEPFALSRLRLFPLSRRPTKAHEEFEGSLRARRSRCRGRGDALFRRGAGGLSDRLLRVRGRRLRRRRGGPCGPGVHRAHPRLPLEGGPLLICAVEGVLVDVAADARDPAVGLILPEMPGARAVPHGRMVFGRTHPDRIVRQRAVGKDRLVEIDGRKDDRPLAVMSFHLSIDRDEMKKPALVVGVTANTVVSSVQSSGKALRAAGASSSCVPSFVFATPAHEGFPRRRHGNKTRADLSQTRRQDGIGHRRIGREAPERRAEIDFLTKRCAIEQRDNCGPELPALPLARSLYYLGAHTQFALKKGSRP
jgi:hypothetical protein